ncbi:hypothetical protein B0H16DRAFT_1459076 [Mycena metata]|uniref:Uncharacterized protein n=1 Tax=Mycena metata TaxID=1033252 RepID=A0AAD7J0R7_9AGAR|nr:hypothetical protein B0H16DRAFT_1459076 [Mycena metata]
MPRQCVPWKHPVWLLCFRVPRVVPAPSAKAEGTDCVQYIRDSDNGGHVHTYYNHALPKTPKKLRPFLVSTLRFQSHLKIGFTHTKGYSIREGTWGGFPLQLEGIRRIHGNPLYPQCGDLGDCLRPSTNYGGWWPLPLRRSPPSPPPSPPFSSSAAAAVVAADFVPSATAITVRGTTGRLLYKIKQYVHQLPVSTNFSVLETARTSLWSVLLCAILILSDVQNRLKANIGVCLIVVRLPFATTTTRPPHPTRGPGKPLSLPHLILLAAPRRVCCVELKLGSASPAACLCTFKLQRHALVPASRKVSCPPTSRARTHISLKTQSGRVFAEFYQATTFSILTPLAAAVCAESDNQQDMEPEDSEPYLNTSDSDTAIATTDTEAAGPTPPGTPCCVSQACSGGIEFRTGPSSTRTGTSLQCSPAELAELNPEEYRQASKEARWAMGVGLWSTFNELVELAEPVEATQ